MSSNLEQRTESIDTNEHNSRDLFGLTALKHNHKAIRRLKRQSGVTHHGNKVWKSGIVMIDYLREFPPKPGAKVMDVGCGWGLSGLFCAKYYGCDVVSVDIDEGVFPYLNLHAQLNGVAVTTVKKRYENITKNDLSTVDLVIGADICFWDDMTKPLIQLAKRAYKARCQMIVTDPGRPPFLDMAEFCQNKLEADLERWSVAEPFNHSGYVLDMPAP